MTTRRVLLSAYQCAPGQGSVSQIGWEWYSRLAQHGKVTLVTHSRNRQALTQAGAPLPGTEVIYIDTEWFAGRLYRLARLLFPRSEHSVFLLSSLDFFVYDRMACQMLRDRADEWDVIHVPTPVSPAAFTGMTRFGLPLVRGPLNGGLRSPKGFDEFMRADSAWLYPIRELARVFRGLLAPRQLPSAILTANTASQNQLTNRECLRVSSMHEIAVEPELYSAMPWPEAPSALNPLRVLFTGRLIPAKALPLLLRAMRRISAACPVELTVIGDGPMRAAWEQEARQLEVSTRFLGACAPQRVAEELNRCHVFCLPSVRESGGAVLMEAMSAARPVLAVNYGGPAGIVTNEVGRLIPAASPETVITGLVEAMQDIFRSPAEWRSRGEAGRKHALLHHTWESRIQSALQLFDQAVSGHATDIKQEQQLELSTGYSYSVRP